MKIREARSEDASAMARVHVDAWQTAYRGVVPQEHLDGLSYAHRTEKFREFLRPDSARGTYVAVQDSEIIGFLIVGDCRDEDLERSAVGEIWGVYVHPSAWRRGIGRLLCNRGTDLLRESRHSEAVLWVLAGNARACRFYETIGFLPDGAEKMVPLGTPMRAIRYRKSIATA